MRRKKEMSNVTLTNRHRMRKDPPMSSLLRDQLVAEPPDREQIPGLGGIVLDLFPDATDMHHQTVLVTEVVVPPDRLTQGIAGDDLLPVVISLQSKACSLAVSGCSPFGPRTTAPSRSTVTSLSRKTGSRSTDGGAYTLRRMPVRRRTSSRGKKGFTT